MSSLCLNLLSLHVAFSRIWCNAIYVGPPDGLGELGSILNDVDKGIVLFSGRAVPMGTAVSCNIA